MRIDASSLLSLKPELMDLLKNLEVGDILRGRVLEALGNSVAIRTASGQVFTAVLMEGAKLQKGASVELIVSSIGDGKVYAEFKTESKAADMEAKVSELLRQLSLPVDEKNLEAAKLLIKYKLPLNKEVISNIAGLQKSIESLNQNSEGRVGLLLSGLDIKNTPVDVLNKIVISWPTESVNSESSSNANVKTINSPFVNIIADESNIEAEQPAITTENQKAEKEIIIKDSMTSIREAITDSKIESTGTNKLSANEIIIPAAAKDKIVQMEADKGIELLRVLDKLGIEAGDKVKKFAIQVADILASIKGTDMEAITYLISKEMKATPKNLGQLMKNIENSDGISQFLDKLQHKIDASDNPELKEIKASVRKIFLEPRQVEDSKVVSEQLKDIVKLGEKLESYLNSSGNKDPEIRDTLSNLRDNIDFMKNINGQNNYIQLPLLINGDTSTAKLYVFKEGKRGKAINPENATILVALDLKNLGHMESLIGVKGKFVNVTFRVENKSIGTLIEKQSLLLKNSLMEKGYNLSPVKVINLEHPFNLLSLEAMINDGNSTKIHFDMRI